MTNILIIGGSGCIGSGVSKWLIENAKANKVICASRGETSSPKIPGAVYAKADITDLDSLVNVMISHEVTHILHTAALRTTDCHENPRLATDINITGTANVYEAAHLAQTVKRVVFISTAAVYDQVEVQEEYVNEEAPTKGYATYVATKLAGEDLARSFSREYEMEIIVIRPQILFGPSRGTEGSTAGVTNAIRALAQGKKFTIPFSGQYSFHFTEDVPALLGSTLLKAVKEKFSIYNLPGDSIDIKEIVEILNSFTGEKLITYKEKQYPFAQSVCYKKFTENFGKVQLSPFKQALNKSFKHFPKT